MRCSKCKWFFPIRQENIHTIEGTTVVRIVGECRLDPPKRKGDTGEFTITQEDWYCSNYEQKDLLSQKVNEIKSQKEAKPDF